MSNKNKIPSQRTVEASEEAIVDMGYAWGRDRTFEMVTDCPSTDNGIALNRYLCLGSRPTR